MTNEEILTKAIEKAVANGWHSFGRDVDTGYIIPNHKVPQLVDLVHSYDSGQSSFTVSVNDIIFSHDFAKALWGEKIIETAPIDALLHWGVTEFDYTRDDSKEFSMTKVFGKPAWQYHLKEMVIANDPIKYLGDHL